MRIKATANGLQVTEPQVVAKINGNAPTSPKPLSEVIARYGKHIDFDMLRTIGHQTVHIGENTVVFEFTR